MTIQQLLNLCCPPILKLFSRMSMGKRDVSAPVSVPVSEVTLKLEYQSKASMSESITRFICTNVVTIHET